MSILLLKPQKAAEYDLQFWEMLLKKHRDKQRSEQNIFHHGCPGSQPRLKIWDIFKLLDLH